MKAALIFPNQLFENNPAIKGCKIVCLAEHPHYFGDSENPLRFHKKKLILHRASMKSYESFLRKKNYDVRYFEYSELNNGDAENNIFRRLKSEGVDEIHIIDTVDFNLEKRINEAQKNLGLKLIRFENPAFLTEEKIFDDLFAGKKNFLMAKFYTEQRKRLNILMDDAGKPVGGKWSFDDENRKRLPKAIVLPEIGFAPHSKIVTEACRYVEKHFPKNPGTSDNFIYPIDHSQAEKWFDRFLEERFEKFGDYEDAMDSRNAFLFHSVITPALNIGLITPRTIVSKAVSFAEGNNVPANSLEGFIRQVIGWREFIRLVYIKKGEEQRTKNYWKFNKKIPAAFYSGTTGIEPVDIVINRVIENSYCHHIERLMILGNFMLLCEIHPDEVYKWFMEMFIDSYDWVMVPNVYGMSQFADGGMMATKPYISSSNYVRKMSNFAKGNWCSIWDALYWRFVSNHADFFRSNPRLSIMIKQLSNMDKAKLNSHFQTAEKFLSKLS